MQFPNSPKFILEPRNLARTIQKVSKIVEIIPKQIMKTMNNFRICLELLRVAGNDTNQKSKPLKNDAT